MKRKLVASLMIALMISASMPHTLWANEVVEPAEGSVSVTKLTDQYKVTHEKAKALGQILVSQFGVPSMQYALVVDGEVVVSGAEAQTTATGDKIQDIGPNTQYGIGSVSKMYTVAAMMKLVEMGKVDLDTPVVKYIPEFEMADERYKDITPRMLLNHSSGLMGSTFEDTFLFEDVDTYAHDTLLEQLKGQRLKANPGEFSVYCNDGFTLAEIVIEHVSGMSYTKFVTEQLLKPLGLEKTQTPENMKAWENLADTYNPMYPGVMPREVVNAIGTGGIYATAEDLATFGSVFSGKTNVLTEKSVAAMAVNEAEKGIWPEQADSSLDYGLGWDSVELYPFNEYGIQALMKGGDTLNYHASLIVLPEYNMSVAVTSAGGSSGFNQLVGTQILLEALKEKGDIEAILPDKTFEAPVAAKLPESQRKYEGFYVAMGQLTEVAMDETGLLSLTLVDMPQVPAQTFQYTEEGVFRTPDGSSSVKFVEETNGATYLYVQGYAMIPGFGQVASDNYNAQKIEPGSLTEEEQLAWNKRSGKLYYKLNEKYTSATYVNGMPVAGVAMNDKVPGYMGGYEITGPNTAKAVGQIPGASGRDQMDITFYEKEGVEYLQLGSSLCISQEALTNLYKGNGKTTIGEDGYAKWYRIGEDTAGRTITVKEPDTGAFAVYDANGICVNYTSINNNPVVTLPVGGTVIFMGDAGTVFEIEMK